MLLWYVLYSALFMCISVYLGEIDVSVISALKSHVSLRIAGHCIMHSKIGSHFSFSLIHMNALYKTYHSNIDYII